MGRVITKVFDEHDGSRNYQPENHDCSGVWLGEMTTITHLLGYMKQHNIPETAWIRYAGCGSHQIEFFWPDPDDEEDDRLWAG